MMSEEEDAWRRFKDACLSGSVPELEALIKERELILDQVSSLTGFFMNDSTPLHVAALRGHLDLAKALLTWKPKLATELDSRQSSPLHLACMEGHFEIVEELLRVDTDACLGRDENDMIPLHLAAIKGRVEVIPALLRDKPESILKKLDGGKTVLHLCVKSNRLEALKTLVQYLQTNDKEILLKSGDNHGNTILHLAADLKQTDTIKYLLEIKIVKDNAKDENLNGATALNFVERSPNKDIKTMEILEIFFQAGIRRPPCGWSNSLPEDNPPQRRSKAREVLLSFYLFWIKYFKVNHTWLREVRGHLITAATLTATMAYQAILNPPGGFRNQTMNQQAGPEEKSGVMAPAPAPDSTSPHFRRHYLSVEMDEVAGTANFDRIIKKISTSDNNNVTGSAYRIFYRNPDLADYMLVNTLVLIASFCTIMLALSGFPADNKFLIWLLVFTVYITIFCMSHGYFLAMELVFPGGVEKYALALEILWYSWIGVCGYVLVLHACHFLVWLWNKFGNHLVGLWNKFEDLVKTCWHYISGCGFVDHRTG